MDLPTIIADLLAAQAKFDSIGYANCFSETAVVFDEGETHKGKTGIQQWNEKTNAKYRTVPEPIEFTTNAQTGMLTAKVSGTFAGSPAR
jgi:hypothetical protein